MVETRVKSGGRRRPEPSAIPQHLQSPDPINSLLRLKLLGVEFLSLAARSPNSPHSDPRCLWSGLRVVDHAVSSASCVLLSLLAWNPSGRSARNRKPPSPPTTTPPPPHRNACVLGPHTIWFVAFLENPKVQPQRPRITSPPQLNLDWGLTRQEAQLQPQAHLF